ncbi:MAG: HlyD family efflux transporter periplasmic adaptor subunit [Pirellulaceae bacterium]
MSLSESPLPETPSEPSPLIRPSETPPPKKTQDGHFSAGLLFNLIIPVGLIVAGFLFVKYMGVATAPPREADDATRAGRLRALAAVRVEEIKSLESTGEQLQLIVDGTVVPYREARVAAEVAGRIIEKSPQCEAGSVVKKGDLLMKIDPTDYEIEVDSLTRQKEQAYQQLQEIDQEKLNQARLIKVAQRDVDLQQREVDRQESMPKGFASPADIDRANRSLIQAEQQLIAAQNQLALLDTRRVRLEASEKLAATQLKAANLNLERTEIIAPIDGVIVTEDADLNTFVNRGTVLLTIEDTSKVEVATSLRMDQLYWVLDQKHSGDISQKTGYDLPETEAIIQYDLSGRDNESYRWKGRLLSYDGVGLDPQTRTVPVRVLVDDPKAYFDQAGATRSAAAPTALLRGMYVQVKLQIKPLTPLVVIPGKALQPGNRVWQFLPDESVLSKPVTKDAETVDGESVAIAETAPQPADQPETAATDAPPAAGEVDEDAASNGAKFDAAEWSPGRVIVQKSVYPVDALTYTVGDMPKSKLRFESTLSGERQFWVCETKGENFGAGNFVVTSPLSGVDGGGADGDGLTARAKLNDSDSNVNESDESPIKAATATSPNDATQTRKSSLRHLHGEGQVLATSTAQRWTSPSQRREGANRFATYEIIGNVDRTLPGLRARPLPYAGEVPAGTTVSRALKTEFSLHGDAS